MKHSRESPEHLVQACVYGYMAGKDWSLMNTLAGTITRGPYQDVSLWIRAALAMKQGLWARNPKNRPLCDTGNLFIAYDVETSMVYPDLVTEVGAIAFTRKGYIIGVHHTVASGVKEMNTTDVDTDKFVETLVVVNSQATRQDQKRIKNSFHNFMNEHNYHKPLQWKGKDDKHLNVENGHDAGKWFKAWLSHNNLHDKTSQSQSSVVRHLLGSDRTYVPHRAYEDACGLSSICLAIT